jgi:putative membrane protein
MGIAWGFLKGRIMQAMRSPVNRGALSASRWPPARSRQEYIGSINDKMLITSNIPLSYIFGKIKYEMIYITLIGVLAYTVNRLFEDTIPPMPIAIPAFLGTAISVILSFKLNQSYDRWWEARKIWGSIVNDSRNLVLQLQSFAPLEVDAVRTIVYRQIAWCYALGRSLRGHDPLAGLQSYVSQDDLRKLSAHHNKPLALMQLNAADIAQLRRSDKLDTFSHVQLNNTIVNLTNAGGMVERIKSTVFPATYRLFLRFFIFLFVVTLSNSLSGVESYFEIPLLLIISSVFFLLEKTATHLQDPFSNKPTDTPVTSIANVIEINLKQLIGETDIPGLRTDGKFYVL